MFARGASLRRRWVPLVAVSVAALVASEPAAVAESTVAAAPAKPAPVAMVDSLVAAQVTARAQGSRVEVGELRSETSTTWVNPDGTSTTEAHQGPIRFKDAKGAWQDVDLTLAAATDGSVMARGHGLGLSVAGDSKGAKGGARSTAGTDLVAVDEKPGKNAAARQVVLGWPGLLGKPTVSGVTAEYGTEKAGTSVSVESRRTGFEVLVQVKDAASLPAANSDGSYSWSFPVKTKGLTGAVEADGSVAFRDAQGTVVSRFAPPMAWDAEVDPRAGEHTATTPATLAVAQQGAGKATLTVTVPGAWVRDPARVWPVTVDPTYASATVAATYDTYASSAYPTTNYGTATELKVGTWNGGTDKNRSFLYFGSIANLSGKTVESASLSLYETTSYSCTAKSMSAYNSGAPSSATTWNNQPTMYSLAGSVTVAKGYSGCAAGRVAVPITSLMKSWATSGNTAGALRLVAGSETDNYYWKKFSSLEAANDPYITFTYDRKPNAASAPVFYDSNSGSSYTTLGGSTSNFAKTLRPTFKSTATDPDGNGYSITVEVHSSTTTSSTTLKSSCTSPRSSSPYTYTPSGGTASCALGADLPNNALLYARTAVLDDQGLWNGSWSPWFAFYTAANNPPAPSISCNSGFTTSGTWLDSLPAGTTVTCTITAAGIAGDYSTPGYVDVTKDGVTTRVKIAVSNDPAVAKTTVTFNGDTQKGGHSITAVSVSRSLRTTAAPTFTLGWGSASLAYPTVGTASSGKIRVKADGPPRGGATGVSAKIQWRVAGSGNETTGWTDAGSAVAISATSSTTPVAWDTTFDLRAAVREAGAAADVPSRTPVSLDVQVCFLYTGSATQCTWSQSARTVTRIPHAFGNGYPTADAGPGQVALFTGEYAMSATDISVPGYSSTITIDRSHTSFNGDGTVAGWAADPVQGVFGPGWTGNFVGPDGSGAAGMTVVDNTLLDGTIVLVDQEGSALVYASPTKRVYPAAGTNGVEKITDYTPVTLDTVADDSKLSMTVTGTGTSATYALKLTDADKTATTWAPLTALSSSASTPTSWKPTGVYESGQAGQTTYGYTSGKVTRIVAATPTGFTGSCPTSGTLVKGCRALDITYATTTTATATTPGSFAGQVASVTAQLWDPVTSAMKATVVATYTYDTTGRLITVTDPRLGLGTTYTWDGATTRIASVTSGGLASWHLTYDSTSKKLTKVTRDNPVAGGAEVPVAGYVYNVATSGTGLPDVSATTVATWNQIKAPADNSGFAVFGQDYPGLGAMPTTGPTNTADWSYADLQYTDDLGYTVNTASYGDNTWLRAATDYDTNGNVVRSLDARALTSIVATPGLSAADIDARSSQTQYAADGVTVTDTYAPVRSVTLPDGSVILGRPHTHTDYDQGANPATNPATETAWNLPTTITAGVSDTGAAANSPDAVILTKTTNGYSPNVAGDGDGWTLGQPTKTTTVTDDATGTGITRITRFDTEGKVIETRQPMSSGSDAGTTRTFSYTADASSGDPACNNRPEWAGLTCKTIPAAAPSSGGTLPTSVTTYTMWLQPDTVTETSGTTTRTTTTTYDAATRAIATSTTGGLGAAITSTATVYDTGTGLVTDTGARTGTSVDQTNHTTTGYDRWGRATSSTNTTEGISATTTTTYDAAGRVKTVNDSKGTTTYTYGSATDRRPLVTGMTITRAGAADLAYTATYNQAGDLTSETLPGALVRTQSVDEVGQPIGLTLAGTITPGTYDEATGTWTPDTSATYTGSWLSWALERDGLGRVVAQATGQGAGFDTTTGVTSLDQITNTTNTTTGTSGTGTVDVNGTGLGYDRTYTYDRAGRLATATEQLAATSTSTAVCTQRTYTFDNNGRRTAQATTTHPDGDCTTTGTTVTDNTNTYDTADRRTQGRNATGTYTYDPFGRVTTLPAADTPIPGGTDLTLNYFVDDTPQSVAQNGVTTTYTRDYQGRRVSATTSGGTGGTQTLRRVYADTSDNPAWTTTTTSTGTTTTRYTPSISGDLSATIDATTGVASLSISDPHGDTVTTIPLPADGTNATTCTGWASYDEYGNPTDNTPTGRANNTTVAGTIGYGWLGAKERATSADTAGLTLMGDRYYNPATGLFTATDPEPGGNDNAYTYPNDPINQLDLDGHWSLWGGLKAAGSWAWRHRGAIATGAATAGCLVPAVGWAACGAMQAAAFGIRSQQTVSRVGWRRGWRSVVTDGAMTSLSFGMGSALRYTKYGALGGRWWNSLRGASSRGWRPFTQIGWSSAWRTTSRGLRWAATASFLSPSLHSAIRYGSGIVNRFTSHSMRRYRW